MESGRDNRSIGRRRLSLSPFAAVLIACTSSHANVSPASATAVAGVSPATAGTRVSLVQVPECYTLSYTDSAGGGESRLFPTWIEILPGSDSGAVRGRHHAAVSESDWRALLVYSGWRKIAGDSLEIMFTGNYEGIRIHVARSNGSLSGRATWLTDVIGLRTTSLPLVGTRVSCPVAGPA